MVVSTVAYPSTLVLSMYILCDFFNINELNNNNNVKDNFLDLYTICQTQFNGLLKNLTQLICCTQVFEAGKVFCDSFPNVGVRKDPKFLPFPHFLLATYT